MINRAAPITLLIAVLIASCDDGVHRDGSLSNAANDEGDTPADGGTDEDDESDTWDHIDVQQNDFDGGALPDAGFGRDATADTAESEAVNICGEIVPEERHVDGIPAYDHCLASENGSIWSNDGVNTRNTSGGDGWVRTQWIGGYECTEYAYRYIHFVWGIDDSPNGEAGAWCEARLPTGLVKRTYPSHGDLIVFKPGSCGANLTFGHVAVVDEVDGSSVTFVAQNKAKRRTCPTETAACFLHAVANNP